MRRALRLLTVAALAAGTLQTARAAEPAQTARFALGKPVADRTLAARRGGTDTRSEATLQGSVGGNQAVNVTTGGNLITGGALAGAAGLPVVVQNSGNNVLIQTSVIVNLQLK